MQLLQSQTQLNVNVEDETAPLSVYRDTTSGKSAAGSGTALHTPHILSLPFLLQ